jgi:hypothetical protein
MKVCSTIASKRLKESGVAVSVLPAAARVLMACVSEKTSEAPEAEALPARLTSSARAASRPDGSTARATSRTMSLGGDIAKKCRPLLDYSMQIMDL